MTPAIAILCAFAALAASTACPTAAPVGSSEPGASRLGTPLVDARFDGLVAEAERHRLQMLVGVVDESTTPPTLRRRGFRADAEYFYPASTIKLCAAVGALLTVQRLQEAGAPVTAETPLEFAPLFPGDATEDADESNLESGAITVAHEIRKLFIVSDNRAFNRLLNLVGRDELNAMMHDAGLDSVRIAHRLAVGHSREQNRRSPAVSFLVEDDSDERIDAGLVWRSQRTLSVGFPERTSPEDPDNVGVPGLEVGEAEMVGGERREGPKSFRFSNRISLEDLQDALVMVVRPDVDLGKPGFDLTEQHRALLLDAMAALPRDSANPRYDAAAYPDDYAKFTLPGLRRVPGGDRVRVFNKIGLAYGFTTVTEAYGVGDEPPEVFLAGTIYTNANATLNDNVYEYDEIAMPFWADVGEAVARDLLRLPNAETEAEPRRAPDTAEPSTSKENAP